MNLYSVEDITKTEIDIIIEVFTNPTVQKYLTNMGRHDLMELAHLSVTERNDSEVAKKHALIQGKLSIIATLLSIKKEG